MKSSFLRELTLYRFRYYIGYGLFAALLVLILTVNVTSIPNGLTDAEMNSAVASNQISLTAPHTADIVNLPYHLAQKVSISLLGLTPLAIKLPSILLAFVTGVTLAFMLSHWFSRNVAVLASLLACTSVPFITMGRTGAPWKFAALASAILLLYTPLGIYPFVALTISGLLHPHIRHQIKRTKPWQIAVFALLSIILLAPLVVAAIVHPAVLLAITGVDSFITSFGALQASVASLAKTFFSFSQSYIGVGIAPYFTFTIAALMLLGLFRVIKDHYAARSYMLLIWSGIAMAIIVLIPSQTHLIFAPAILFLAIGVETLIREWYRLFPRNPYARIGALIPLSIIVIGTITVDVSRYFDGHLYTPHVQGFHAELPAVREAFGNDAGSTKRLVVPADQVNFYDILRREYPHLTVATSTVQDATVRQAVLAGATDQPDKPPTTIFTGPLQDDGVLVRVFGPKPLRL
jgi:hypothetical protein